MSNLIKWIIRHLNDPRLIVWIANRGGLLHEKLACEIENQLDHIHHLELEGNVAELENIRNNSPNAIPCQMMRIVWGMILNGQLKSPERNLGLYTWKRRLDRDGLTASLRKELRELLSPKIAIQSLRFLGRESSKSQEITKLNEIFNWNLVLFAEGAREVLRDIVDNKWKAALPSLFEDFQILLLDALQLLQETGEADSKRDHSQLGLSSIIPHWQNRGSREWVALIELVRDSWLTINDKDLETAKGIALAWFKKPFPTFKRLAFYAAGQNECISSELWVQWLLKDSSCWLWSEETRREVLRLFVQQGTTLEVQNLALLESAILEGPPRQKFPDDIEPERWQLLLDDSIWLRLVKLRSSGITLGSAASEKLSLLTNKYPQRKLALDGSDEFPIWISGTGDPGFKDSREIEVIPRKRDEILAFLEKQHTAKTWCKFCKRHLMKALFALKELGEKGIWTTKRWSLALNAWSDTKRRAWWSWRYAATVMKDMPNDEFFEIIRDLSRWLLVVSKTLDRQELLFLNFCKRVLDSPISADTGMTQNGKPFDHSVIEAINHPVGDVTQALIKLWFSRKPNDNDQIPKDFEPFFTDLCDVRKDRFRHGRVILASWLITLFRVDRAWTEQNLLPLFDWSAYPSVAKYVWQGFFSSPRLYPPLMIAIKPQFVECTRHYHDLGEYRDHFAALLTHAALYRLDGYTNTDFRDAFRSLPQEGLEASARSLVQALASAGEQREEFWKNRIKPFWHDFWPKSVKFVTPHIVESLYRICIAAGPAFPMALKDFQDFLKTSDSANLVVLELKETDLCSKFPDEALLMLSLAIDEKHRPIRDLRDCLNLIAKAAPNIQQSEEFLKLDAIIRKLA